MIADPEATQSNVPTEPTDADVALPVKRLTIDIPQTLHTAFKMDCSSRNTTMARDIRDWLVERYPDSQKRSAP